MRRITPNPRGMALVMAMIVVVLITLLVAGAISFTGTERAASEVQTQQDSMSACTQAARNLFLSKVRMTLLDMQDPASPTDPTKRVLPIKFTDDLMDTLNTENRDASLRTGHLGSVETWTAKKVEVLDDPRAKVRDETSTLDGAPPPTFYTVTAVCRESASDPTSPEREIEFMVRVGM